MKRGSACLISIVHRGKCLKQKACYFQVSLVTSQVQRRQVPPCCRPRIGSFGQEQRHNCRVSLVAAGSTSSVTSVQRTGHRERGGVGVYAAQAPNEEVGCVLLNCYCCRLALPSILETIENPGHTSRLAVCNSVLPVPVLQRLGSPPPSRYAVTVSTLPSLMAWYTACPSSTTNAVIDNKPRCWFSHVGLPLSRGIPGGRVCVACSLPRPPPCPIFRRRSSSSNPLCCGRIRCNALKKRLFHIFCRIRGHP